MNALCLCLDWSPLRFFCSCKWSAHAIRFFGSSGGGIVICGKERTFATAGSFSKRRRSDPDLLVILDDGMVKVHSLVLEQASSYFSNILEPEALLLIVHTDSVELSLRLQGRTKGDFQTFYNSLMIHTQEDLTSETALVLSEWASDYDVAGLRHRCDLFMMSLPVDAAALQHGLKYGLENRVRQCLDFMAGKLPRFIGDLRVLIRHPDVLKEHWALICEQAGLSYTPAFPPTEHLESMWDFIASAVRSLSRLDHLEKLLDEAVF